MAEITLESLTKVYPDGTKAVTDLDLEVAAGEFVVFVGPSGCGKTTALRMIAGLESITSGQVMIDGQVVNDLPPKDRDIAMVFQNYALYPHMNAAKNMGFALKMRGLPKDEIDSRVREAARILGLSDSLHKKPRTLSGGQRQRVAMGRAIVRNPQAFLMDEPLSNLDAKLRVEMRAEIARIQRDLGVTTIYVTHDQTEAMTMGDRVAVMRNGFLQQIADPEGALRAAAQPVRRRVHRVSGDEPRHGPGRARETATSGSRSARTGCASSRRRSSGTRASRPTTGARSSSGSGRRTWRTPPLAAGDASGPVISVVCDIREDMGSEVYVHFNVPAEPVTTREVVEALVVEDAEDEEARLAAERARGGGVVVRRPPRADDGRARATAARPRGRRHAPPLLRPGDGNRESPRARRILRTSARGSRNVTGQRVTRHARRPPERRWAR